MFKISFYGLDFQKMTKTTIKNNCISVSIHSIKNNKK